MLIKLGGRLKIPVEELENIDGGTSVYRDTARNEMCVKIKISVFLIFLYFYIFFAKCWRKSADSARAKGDVAALPCHTIVHEIAHAVNQFLGIEREDNGQNSGEVSKPCLCFLEKPFSVAQPFEEAGFALECLVFGGILNLLGTDHETNVKGLRYGIQITNHLWTSNNYSVWPRKWRTV
jgi:hypothetical protein